jgi:hypothetical protein
MNIRGTDVIFTEPKSRAVSDEVQTCVDANGLNMACHQSFGAPLLPNTASKTFMERTHEYAAAPEYQKPS